MKRYLSFLSLLFVCAVTTLSAQITISPKNVSMQSGQQYQFKASTIVGQWLTCSGTVTDSGLYTAPPVTQKTTSCVGVVSADYASVSVAVVSVSPSQTTTSATVPLGENAYCAPGDVWTGEATDGPAELPKRCVYTGSFPSPGKVITVATPDTAGLRNATTAAQCGDIIEIPSNFNIKFLASWTLPAKPCDAAHWITIRTSDYAKLPPAGTRVTPCYAGVASLPDRPAYPCSTPVHAMPRVYVEKGGPLIKFEAGANHYLFLGLELTRTIGTGIVYDVFSTIGADHIVIDRSWLHGSSGSDETKNGVSMTDSTYIAVTNSYLNDYKCVSITGACSDSHAFGGGDGKASAEGPWKIYNDFIEATTEDILFGGGGSGVTSPEDVEIRLNHLYKCPSWNPKAPNYVAPVVRSNGYSVKNIFEFKNVKRALVEGNVGEYSWGGFTQTGWAFVFTPRGTWGHVEDVTVRYNKFSHVGSGLQLAASKASSVTGAPDSAGAGSWSIHDIVVEDVDSVFYNGSGQAWQLSSGYLINPPLHDVTLDHITMFNHVGFPGNLMIIGEPASNGLLPNITITNNFLRSTDFNIWSTGSAGVTCVKNSNPLTSFSQCWNPYRVVGNVIAGYNDPAFAKQKRGAWPDANWPTDDPQGSMDSVQFVNFNGGNGGDYHLQPTSPYHNAGTDGKDVGANVDAVDAAVAFSQ
jgi:hypothetical protein